MSISFDTHVPRSSGDRPGRRARCRLLAFLVLATAGAQALFAQAEAPAPRSAEELAERFRKAQAQKDLKAIQALFFWGKATTRVRLAVRNSIDRDLARAATAVAIKPLSSGQRMSETLDGVTYRPTLDPVASLEVTFAPVTRGKILYKPATSSFLVGARDGRYYLLTAEPADSIKPPDGVEDTETPGPQRLNFHSLASHQRRRILSGGSNVTVTRPAESRPRLIFHPWASRSA